MKERRSRTPDLPVRLSDGLLPTAQIFYDWAIPRTQQLEFEHAQHGVIRMNGMREKGFPIPSDFSESNHIHTYECCAMAREYHNSYANLREHIDFSSVQLLLIPHDSGEMAKHIGDVQPLGRTRRDEAKKRLEPRAAREAVISQIKNPAARQKVLDFYNRYFQNDRDDLEVQMARFIDKAQGTTRVANVAFNAVNAKDEAVLKRMKAHLWQTVPRMMEPALHLLVGLPTRDARRDMRDIVLGELGILEQYGPKEVARTFINGVKGVAA